MSDRVEWFTVTVPAGTPVATPIVTPLVFDFGTVTQIDVIVPPGPSGNVGFSIGAGGSQYVPRTKGSVVVADDKYLTWPMANAINSGSWSLTAYNTGVYPHTLEVGFHIDEVGDAHVTPSSTPASSSALLDNATTVIQPDSSPAVDPLSLDALLASVQEG